MEREESETRHPVTATVSRIQESHRRIRRDLEVLDKSDDLGQIRAVVNDLPDLLAGHFEDEEKPDGLFDHLASLRPVLNPQIEALRRDHREITQALEALQQHLHGVERLTQVDDLEERRQNIRVRASVFLQLIHLHERIESRLVAETYYVEDGGSG
jgi:hemerythrin-like domain-containing protein